MKKISLISLNPIIGGQEIYLLDLIKNLKEEYHLTFFTKLSVWKNTELFQYKNIHLVDIDSISYKHFLKVKQNIISYSSLDDILIFNGNRAIYLGTLFSNKYKKIAIQHSSLYDMQDGQIKKNLRVYAYKFLLQRYAKLIGIAKNSVKPLLGSKKVEVILNGINTAKFHKSNNREKNSDYKTILMVGILNDNKGQYEALEILKYLDNSFKLVIVGEGEDRDKINSFIEENQLSERVILTGKISNVVDYYSRADVLLFMSKNEGLPLTIIEAMACQLPVVTTRAGGIPEIIEDKVNGVFIQRDNKVDIAIAIQTLMEDNKLRDSIVNNAYELVQSKLNLTAHVNHLKNIIESI